MEGPAEGKEILLPSISFSLAAIVRRRPSPEEDRAPDKYLLVHERPPRGWWLPGGGVESADATPVVAAVREVVEEAGAPSLLPLLSTGGGGGGPLPSMTHLLRIEQSPGRIRFIFRGEWGDESADGVLKRAPGDEESIEAKWLTLNEMQFFRGRTRGERTELHLRGQTMVDPWLRGWEPLTFYGMLEEAQRRENGAVPGLPVREMNLSRERKDEDRSGEAGVLGAFFGCAKNASTQASNVHGLTHHGRAALLTHLKCRLLVCDNRRKTVAVDAVTMALPSAFVNDQHNTSLRQLVDQTIADAVDPPRGGRGETRTRRGILRVEYVVHENGRESTLTVFPYVCLPSTEGALRGAGRSAELKWAAAEDIADDLERNLARAALAEPSGTDIYCYLNILRDREEG